jgi:hypothetical protein
LIFETSRRVECPPTIIFAFLFVYWWTDTYRADELAQCDRTVPHLHGGDYRIGGGGDDRDVVAALVRHIDEVAIRGHGNASGTVPHLYGGNYRIGGGVDDRDIVAVKVCYIAKGAAWAKVVPNAIHSSTGKASRSTARNKPKQRVFCLL